MTDMKERENKYVPVIEWADGSDRLGRNISVGVKNGSYTHQLPNLDRAEMQALADGIYDWLRNHPSSEKGPQ